MLLHGKPEKNTACFILASCLVKIFVHVFDSKMLKCCTESSNLIYVHAASESHPLVAGRSRTSTNNPWELGCLSRELILTVAWQWWREEMQESGMKRPRHWQRWVRTPSSPVAPASGLPPWVDLYVTLFSVTNTHHPVFQQAVERMKSEISIEFPDKSVEIEWMILDLASFRSTKDFTVAFRERNLPLHILVNNAGIAWRTLGEPAIR